MKNWLLNLPRSQKRLIQLVMDLAIIWSSLLLSFVVRIGWDKTIANLDLYKWLFFITPVIALPIFIRLGLYRAVLRYINTEFFVTIFRAVSLSALIFTLFLFWFNTFIPGIPRSLVFNYWWISLLLIALSRIVVRAYFLGEIFSVLGLSPSRRKLPRVIIYGAGSAGTQLFTALKMGGMFYPVAFIDDDEHLQGGYVDGKKIFPSSQLEYVIKKTHATELLLAIPSASRSARQAILNQLTTLPVSVRTIPGFMDLAKGNIKVQDLQEVDIADLLGRDAVAPHLDLFDYCLKEQNVLVTGAGGSIGSELCRQIARSSAKHLILFEHSEYNLYRITTELKMEMEKAGLPIKLTPILGSVQNPKRLYDVMAKFNVDTVYHAAAYKHVPIVENNVTQGVANNVFGTFYTAEAAIKAKVKNFVLISTDKAVRPTNVMGATKRLAEMVLQALSQEESLRFTSSPTPINNHTRFTMVRFGNVLGSSGSVIPLFRKQIQEGTSITVTHPDITRYFMTIPEAAELVIQAGSMGIGGDVFVLDMGDPVKIVDLATKMVRLSGLTIRNEQNPSGDIAINFTGLRPGEKLYEELLIGDNVIGTEHPMILSANEDMLPWEQMSQLLSKLQEAIQKDDFQAIRSILLEHVAGYKPQCQIIDFLYSAEE